MTPSTKPTTRLTSATIRERGQVRPIVVTVVGPILELRCKGLRSVETVDIAAIYTYAVRTRTLREKTLKAKAKKGTK